MSGESHSIVEAGNTRPTGERFGVYEYEQMLETFEHRGFVVIIFRVAV